MMTMDIYYFYRDPEQNYTYLSTEKQERHTLEFLWIDSLREDVIGHSDAWQKKVEEIANLKVNEFHILDILNLEHPCAFDAMGDYDSLVFRKLITPQDKISLDEGKGLEQHNSEFGLVTTPVNFLIAPHALVTVREKGNNAIDTYLERLKQTIKKPVAEQNNMRKVPSTPLNLAMRFLSCMIDDYLGLRVPLTRRVEFWQTELLQRSHSFRQWQQLLQENMAFEQVENLCEEQIEVLQELRDEVVEDFHHLEESKKKSESLDLILVRVNDLMSHIERIQKHTSRLRSSIQAAIDLHFSAISNQTNENMRILAVITAVFAPLTLLTGIYGMNFEFIPGLKSPLGFWLMLGAMVVCTILLIIYFYRRHLVGRGKKSVVDMLSHTSHSSSMNLFSFADIQTLKKTFKK